MMNISVIFATYNGSRTLPLMLDAICLLNIPREFDWEIIAIDNNSDDNSADILSSYQDRLPIRIIVETKQGKNRCLNKALGVSQGDLLIFTDDDIIPSKNWLAEYHRQYRDNTDIDIFGGPIDAYWMEKPSREILDEIPLGVAFAINTKSHTNGVVKAGGIWGPNMAIRHAVFSNGLKFNESIGPAGKNYAMGSETDLLNKLEGLGCKAFFNKNATVQHIIRKNQLTYQWLKGRAFRAGRGALHSQQRTSGVKPCTTVLGYPRWVLMDILKHTISQAKMKITNKQTGKLGLMWKKNFLMGFASEYKKNNAKE